MANIDDYYKILDTIHNFDKIQAVLNKDGNIKTSIGYADRSNKPAKLIQFIKTISENIFYVVEAITDGKDKDIKVLSAYQKKK